MKTAFGVCLICLSLAADAVRMLIKYDVDKINENAYKTNFMMDEFCAIVRLL